MYISACHSDADREQERKQQDTHHQNHGKCKARLCAKPLQGHAGEEAVACGLLDIALVYNGICQFLYIQQLAIRGVRHIILRLILTVIYVSVFTAFKFCQTGLLPVSPTSVITEKENMICIDFREVFTSTTSPHILRNTGRGSQLQLIVISSPGPPVL